MISEPLGSEVHVWTAHLDGEMEGRSLAADVGVLSPEERVRAARFRFERDRRRFLVARVALRRLLAAYLEVDPASVHLGSGPHGKPHLASATSQWLRFNASRSADLAVLAVGRDRRLGVDVEHVRTHADLESDARRILCATERVPFDQLPQRARQRVFYRCWTRKEACLKAVGVGLTVAPHEIDVTGDRARMLSADHLSCHPHAGTTWSLHDLDCGPDHVAALAAGGDLTSPPVMRGPVAVTPEDRNWSYPRIRDLGGRPSATVAASN